MKTNLTTVIIMAVTLGSVVLSRAQTQVASSPPAAKEAPRIVFAKESFDAGKINSGDVVKHDYIFTNTGNAVLEITDVRPSCGCTTAGNWDKRVEPGKTGVIPLQFNSSGYAGSVTKAATVTCNDPGKSNVYLQLICTIWKPIDVAPTFTMFNLGPDVQTNETKVVRIVNNLDEPVTVYEPVFTNRAFRAALKTIREGKEFELSLTVIPPLDSGTVTTPIMLKTSSSQMPTLNVTAYAVVQAPVTVTPVQITLPPGPLTNKVQQTITIRNNSTNSLALSEPAINAPGVELKIRELQAGKLFILDAAFPVSFRTSPAQGLRVTVKSNQPKVPLIEVPVFQSYAPPATVTTPTASATGTATKQ